MGDLGKEVRDGAGRRVLDYETEAGGGPASWSVFIGPVSLVGLWLRVLGVLPFPCGGESWHRCEETVFGWLFLTALVTLSCYFVEHERRGKKRVRSPEWMALTFIGTWVLTWVTGVALIVAVAYAHGK